MPFRIFRTCDGPVWGVGSKHNYLVNTTLYISKEENRKLRTKQAEFICDEALNGTQWKWAIIGMDMNDVPGINLGSTYSNCYLENILT